MIVVVTGSRSLVKHVGRLEIKANFLDTIHSLSPLAVFHGGAYGPDSWAAQEFPLLSVNNRPLYNAPDPIKALFDRNKSMVNKAMHMAAIANDELAMVSCWDGKSSGTWDTISYAQQLEIEILHTFQKPEVG